MSQRNVHRGQSVSPSSPSRQMNVTWTGHTQNGGDPGGASFAHGYSSPSTDINDGFDDIDGSPLDASSYESHFDLASVIGASNVVTSVDDIDGNSYFGSDMCLKKQNTYDHHDQPKSFQICSSATTTRRNTTHCREQTSLENRGYSKEPSQTRHVNPHQERNVEKSRITNPQDVNSLECVYEPIIQEALSLPAVKTTSVMYPAVGRNTLFLGLCRWFDMNNTLPEANNLIEIVQKLAEDKTSHETDRTQTPAKVLENNTKFLNYLKSCFSDIGQQNRKISNLNNFPSGSKKKQSVEEKKRKLKEETEKLRQEMLCRVCKSSEAVMLLLPCGHLVTCESCTDALDNCPTRTCGKQIKGVVRTYRG